MKTLDNTIKYYELLMNYDDTSKYKKYELPDNYYFKFYSKGDEYDWINIHIESGEFTSIDNGLKIFHDFYDYFIDELPKRLIFIVDKNTNEKIGTATISLLETKEKEYEAAVDWVAIKKSCQGKGLSKPLISRFISLAHELGHKKIILHTQTTTWLAAKLYLDFGFEILNKESEGWNILKALTNHEKLKDYEIETNIYDERNIKIESLLKEMYKTNDFNYSVWYKNGLHNVYTLVNNESHEYEYFIEDDNIILKEIKKANKKT